MGERGYTDGKDVDPRKKHVFVIEEHIEDVEQDQKTVANVLESRMRPTDPVTEELRNVLMKMNQFRPQIQDFRVCTFWMPGKLPDLRRRLPAGAK